MAQTVKHLSKMQETRVQSLSREDRLEMSESSGGESASGVLHVVGGIKFLAVVGLSSPIPYWLSVGV